MSEFPKRFAEVFGRQPSRLKERFEEFADEQGYVITQIGDNSKGFAFQVLDKNTFDVASKEIHEIFKSQFCILDEVVTTENLDLVEDDMHGVYLHAKPKY